MSSSSDEVILSTRNVKDEYKTWTNDLIKQDIKSKAYPNAAIFSLIHGDFNLACVIRSANSFGIGKVFYYGPKKHIDKRGAVGTHIYTDVVYCKGIEQVKELKKEYKFIALENNIPNKKPKIIYNLPLPQNTMFILGEEAGGICNELMALADDFIEIPSHGSVRSLNAACAASCAFQEYDRQMAFRKMSFYQKLKYLFWNKNAK